MLQLIYISNFWECYFSMLLPFLSKVPRQETNLSTVLVSGGTPRTKKLTTVRVGHLVTKITNKPRPAQVGTISKDQKYQKDFEVSSILFCSTRKSKIFRKKIFRKNYILKKMDRVARRGPLARAPVALKRGHFRDCQHFCRS